MKIAFNPSTVAALTTPPNNKDITFDLRGRNIFARGVKFYGTDTNTWRDIKINNVSIDSNILDLRNGSNTTLTNTNGVVTINSTWRPVVDNLTSDSTTSSLSANLGRVLVELINSKSDSGHTHDDRYLKLTGGTMAGDALITFADSGSWYTPDKEPRGARGGLCWSGQSDLAKLYAEETAVDNLNLVIQFGDDDSNGLSIRNKSNIQTSYISASGVITTSTFRGNLAWFYITNKPATATRWPFWDEIVNKPNTFTPSDHNHDYLIVNTANEESFNSAYHNFKVLYAGGDNGITGRPPGVDAFGLIKLRAGRGYSGQILLANGGSLYIRSSIDALMNNTLAWKTILDSSNYSSILDSRYYTESEINTLLDSKLNRQNLSYGTWNPRGYNLAADYLYNGGDLSISESGSLIHVSVDGYFWLNKGQYRVLDTSDVLNYYWANVKISASANTQTQPSVNTIYANNWFRSQGASGWYSESYGGGIWMEDSSWIKTFGGKSFYCDNLIYSSNSIRMSNILLEHTDEINNSANGNIYLNYRNSGNVSLCLGGGNVGIGTNPLSYKLDVNGLMRASGFHHASMNSDNYMLLAGGGYKSFGGDGSNPIFLGYLDLDHGNDGTISSSFYCLGYSVPFTYTRGGNYCKIFIPDTTRLSFYVKAATASVHYSGGGMDTWVGHHRSAGAWWLHCYAAGWNEVRVKGFRQANINNDSWWGGNPLYSSNDGANRITVCIFGYVRFI